MRYLKWCIEQDLSNVNEWFKANKLTLNVDKSVHMVFGKKNNIETKIRLGNTELPRVEVVKFLGMWVDEDLNWNEHISKLKNKCIRKINQKEKQVNNIYTKYKILRLKEILVLENCKLIHRLEHHRLPRQIDYLFKTNQQGRSLLKQHNYNTRDKNTLQSV